MEDSCGQESIGTSVENNINETEIDQLSEKFSKTLQSEENLHQERRQSNSETQGERFNFFTYTMLYELTSEVFYRESYGQSFPFNLNFPSHSEFVSFYLIL